MSHSRPGIEKGFIWAVFIWDLQCDYIVGGQTGLWQSGGLMVGQARYLSHMAVVEDSSCLGAQQAVYPSIFTRCHEQCVPL